MVNGAYFSCGIKDVELSHIESESDTTAEFGNDSVKPIDAADHARATV
jgi:hypothetical protein